MDHLEAIHWWVRLFGFIWVVIPITIVVVVILASVIQAIYGAH